MERKLTSPKDYPMKLPIEIATAASKELSEAQQAYQDFFKEKLAAYDGATSPAQLTDEQKSEFFSSITKEWKKFKKDNNIQTKA